MWRLRCIAVSGRRLKPCSESDSVMFAGRLFQVTGAAYENDRLAKSVVSLGTVSRGSAADRCGPAARHKPKLERNRSIRG